MTGAGGPGDREGRKVVFARGETGGSNSRARIARLGRRVAKEEKGHEKKKTRMA